MSKNEKDKPSEVVNQPANAPIAPSSTAAVPSRETLSHQWQENSPAINTNAVAGYGADTDNVVAKLEAQQELAKHAVKEPSAKPITQDEYERRTKLDVSNPEYLNPSQDYKVGK